MIIMMIRREGVATGGVDPNFGNVSVNIVLLSRRISLIQSMTVILFSLTINNSYRFLWFIA